MKHTSIRLNSPCELIKLEPTDNPLISKCQIKVLYVGQDPNRNGSIITKEAATKMAQSLPGSPIVGFFNRDTKDFEEHNRMIDLSNGKFEMIDTTRPYGFVDLNAKAWFAKYEDDGVEREYLCTEGFLWTGQYPECKSILEKGKGQSMELDEGSVKGRWTEHGNDEPSFFIINEAIISKLCILGDEVEPCFEGASITNVQFSFDDKFKETLYKLVEQMQELVNKGGAIVNTNTAVIDDVNAVSTADATITVENTDVLATATDFAATTSDNDTTVTTVENDDASNATEDDNAGDNADNTTTESEEDNNVADAPATSYNLEEIPEYIALKEECETLKAQLNELVEFKTASERKEKQAMIDSFAMLSDEDKKDVCENIDTYSLSEIEAKLSVICVRNKVNFNLDDTTNPDTAITFNTADDSDSDETAPEWVKAVRNVAKKNKI